MAILRNPNKERFTSIDNYLLRDKGLSLKARGLLVSMLSLPDNWEFSENGLEKIFPLDGQASIRSGLKELERNGYLTRERSRDELGRMSRVIWTICDNPHLGNPSMDNPNVDIPNLENPPQLNTYPSNTKQVSTKERNTDRASVRHKYGKYDNVLLSDDDLQKLRSEFPDDWEKRIDSLSSYMESTGKHYKNHLATIRVWATRDKDREQASKTESGNPFLEMLREEQEKKYGQSGDFEDYVTV